jgi:hypothetical protein
MILSSMDAWLWLHMRSVVFCISAPVKHWPSTMKTRNRVELRTFILRVMMACVSVFVYNSKWASGAQFVLSSILFLLVWYWQPQLEGEYLTYQVQQNTFIFKRGILSLQSVHSSLRELFLKGCSQRTDISFRLLLTTKLCKWPAHVKFEKFDAV